jgi:hypothetical protein
VETGGGAFFIVGERGLAAERFRLGGSKWARCAEHIEVGMQMGPAAQGGRAYAYWGGGWKWAQARRESAWAAPLLLVVVGFSKKGSGRQALAFFRALVVLLPSFFFSDSFFLWWRIHSSIPGFSFI